MSASTASFCSDSFRKQRRGTLSRARVTNRCPLWRSLSGVKRTCRVAPHMSAFDPKRTLRLRRNRHTRMCVIFSLAARSQVLGFRHCRWRGPYEGHMQRRKFIVLLGGAAATWPLVTQAQQPAILVIGFLHSGSPEPAAHLVAA